VGASKTRHVAEVVRQELGWSEDDARSKCLDKIWEGLSFLTNSVLHPEGGPQPVEPVDARFCLNLTAILSEYLYGLLGG